MFESLSLLDLISLVMLLLIILIVLFSSRGDRSERQDISEADWGHTLTGSISLDADVSLDIVTATDTNDPLFLAYSRGSVYRGPDQTALAMALLDETISYDRITGQIPADAVMFLAPSVLPEYLGSNDPAAGASLTLLDADAHLAEEVLDDPPHATLPTLRLLAIFIALLALLYRLLFI